MNKPAIQVENLGKEYIIGGAEQQYTSFRELLTGSLTAPLRKLRKLGGESRVEERFWALKDVSFKVEQGEVLGIIGRNGAGKSTLLKILSRITAPTEGRVVTHGRVASLLEVGTGFHPELTGRENILLNGAILGMSRREILSKFDEIIAFAEIEKFLDTPVKRYSSGMYVRLAFSVAAHLDADILIVDEVLAVGDQIFQKKCLDKMGNFGKGGRTVLFVSHNMGAITSLCSSAMVLHEGVVTYTGEVNSAVRVYLQQAPKATGPISKRYFIGRIVDEVRFNTISVNGQVLGEEILIDPSDEIRIEVLGRSSVMIKDFDIYASIYKNGMQVLTAQDSQVSVDLQIGDFKSTMCIPPNVLRPGIYSIGVGGGRFGAYKWLWGADLGLFSIIENWNQLCEQRSPGVVNIPVKGCRD